MYDIILEYKKLNEIMKKENGEEGENTYEGKMEEFKNDMSSSMEDYKSKFNSAMPNMNGSIPSMSNFNQSSLTAGFKMPKIF